MATSTQRAPGQTGSALAQFGAVPRAVISLGVGLVTVVTVAAFLFLPWEATALLGWNAAMVVFLVLVWAAVQPMSAGQTKSHALREDSSAAAAGSVIIGAAIACLGAVGLILVKASTAHGGTKAFLIAVGALSVVSSWTALHTIFTLRYARLYYSGPSGGIDFNEADPPTYLDFAYLAFTIGMTFQVSDTNLTSKPIRRSALHHALMSYLFGAMIIGLVINVVASLLQ
jgi:uncharacterized membrane protein